MTVDVSVIIPVYNTRPYLADCLDSLLRQSIGPDRFEVIAVDDGSTDGSGELLDDYAERHPDLLTVVHQENSGGPATPCNVGLDRARGRYVFFLGSDDYLGDEALERMVDKADEWGSDVLCARLVGVGGRWVSQRLFAQTAEDVAFPSELLASALSNTKLFRRSLVEEHHLRFPQRRVASDQPFTLSAMHYARRVSVLADGEYYFAVRREEATNLTYSSTWRTRLDGITAVVRHVADLLPAGEGRDVVLQRHFRGELATLLRRDLAELEATGAHEEQAELVAAVAPVVEEFLTPGIGPFLRVVDRLRYVLVMARDVEGLRGLIGQEEGPQPLLVTDGAVQVLLPGAPDHLTARDLAANDRDAARLLHDATTWSRVGWDGNAVVLRGDVAARFEAPPRLQASLVRSRGGGSRPPVAVPADKPSGVHTVTANVEASSQGCTVSARLEVAPLLERGEVGPWAVRLRVLVGDTAYGIPVSHPAPGHPEVARIVAADATYEARLEADAQGRTVVAVSRTSAPEETSQRRSARWFRKG